MWLRLRQIALVANELQPVLDDFHEMLGLKVGYRDEGVGRFGLENALLPIGNQLLEIVAPIEENTAGGRYLERRGGDGGYMVITQCDEHAPRRKRVEELGIRIVNEFEIPGVFRNMQMHPKDTGGSFFEIDEQLGDGAHDPDGPWHPAGDNAWKSAVNTSRVTGIRAAEVQADDPANVAARWGSIAEIPVTSDEAGNPALELQDATVRFVPVTDGRGEGLGCLDLAVADRDAVLAAAKARDCYRNDSQIAICGMRLNLV